MKRAAGATSDMALAQGDDAEACALRRHKEELTHDLQVLSDRFSTLTSQAS